MTDNVIAAEVVSDEELIVQDKTRIAYAASLRAFAAFIESHPKLALPTTQKLYVFPNVEDMELYAREMGQAKKSGDENYFNLTRSFLPAIEYEPTWYRNQVCERVKVGEETVQEDIVDVTGKRTVTRDKFEWKCPKVLAPKLTEGGKE